MNDELIALVQAADEAGQCAGAALVTRGLTVSTAESCTGGLVAALLVDYPGVSAALMEAHVTYANEAKMKICGVREETLASFGAVSEQTVREMSEGLRARCGADIVAATSGIAGPGGGTEEKPVGMVWIACASAKGTKTVCAQYAGGRQQVRLQAARQALDMVREAAEEYDK